MTDQATTDTQLPPGVRPEFAQSVHALHAETVSAPKSGNLDRLNAARAERGLDPFVQSGGLESSLPKPNPTRDFAPRDEPRAELRGTGNGESRDPFAAAGFHETPEARVSEALAGQLSFPLEVGAAGRRLSGVDADKWNDQHGNPTSPPRRSGLEIGADAATVGMAALPALARFPQFARGPVAAAGAGAATAAVPALAGGSGETFNDLGSVLLGAGAGAAMYGVGAVGSKISRAFKNAGVDKAPAPSPNPSVPDSVRAASATRAAEGTAQNRAFQDNIAQAMSSPEWSSRAKAGGTHEQFMKFVNDEWPQLKQEAAYRADPVAPIKKGVDERTAIRAGRANEAAWRDRVDTELQSGKLTNDVVGREAPPMPPLPSRDPSKPGVPLPENTPRNASAIDPKNNAFADKTGGKVDLFPDPNKPTPAQIQAEAIANVEKQNADVARSIDQNAFRDPKPVQRLAPDNSRRQIPRYPTPPSRVRTLDPLESSSREKPSPLTRTDDLFPSGGANIPDRAKPSPQPFVGEALPSNETTATAQQSASKSSNSPVDVGTNVGNIIPSSKPKKVLAQEEVEARKNYDNRKPGPSGMSNRGFAQDLVDDAIQDARQGIKPLRIDPHEIVRTVNERQGGKLPTADVDELLRRATNSAKGAAKMTKFGANLDLDAVRGQFIGGKNKLAVPLAIGAGGADALSGDDNAFVAADDEPRHWSHRQSRSEGGRFSGPPI